jgi:hypothetical protein
MILHNWQILKPFHGIPTEYLHKQLDNDIPKSVGSLVLQPCKKHRITDFRRCSHVEFAG